MYKYTLDLADRVRRPTRATRGLCIAAPKQTTQLEEGMIPLAALGVAVLTVVLFAIWFVAG